MPTTGSTRCLQTGIIIRAYIVDQRWLILNGQECICVRSLRSKYNDRDDDRMVQARLNILCWILGSIYDVRKITNLHYFLDYS